MVSWLSSKMDDPILVIPSRYITSHPGRLILAIFPWVGAMSTVLAMVTVITREETVSSVLQ